MLFNIPDFRSAERTFNLLSQVAGRAGRASKEGLVIFQGFNLDHYSIKCASKHDYEVFYNYEMNIRKKLDYPPYCNLTSIKIVGSNLDECMNEGEKITNFVHNNIKNNITILGPSMAVLPKINNKYYVQIVLKYKKEQELYHILINIVNKYRNNKKVYVDLDMAPLKL